LLSEKIGVEMGTLILGIGNPILCDDGVGIAVAHKLKEERPELKIEESNEAAIVLLDYVVGYDKLVIIDSIKTGKGPPGELYKLSIDDFKKAADCPSSHGIDIATALEVGKKLGCKMPDSISIYAIEVNDNSNFSEKCTETVEREIPSIVKQIIQEEKL
jgi:hydrogenase maturation protease